MQPHHDHYDHEHAEPGHVHGDGHSYAYDSAHGHDHDHDPRDHERHRGRFGWAHGLLPFWHGHSHAEASIDAALQTSARGIWALKVSLLGLGATAAFQLAIVLLSGSVGLLSDTIHNASDALTAVPLWIAFVLGRRAANRRYTYGFGRAEDVAGLLIVGMIFLSALAAGYESLQKLAHPQPVHLANWVIVAALAGFLGNEAVGVFRIRVGNEIGSAALVADGQHAQVDGLTSLAVVVGALGSLANVLLVDPIVGLLITLAILVIVKDTARTIWRRLMDTVEPEVVDAIERVARGVPGAIDVRDIRARWVGHALQAELNVTVDEDAPTRESHRIAEEVRHALLHAQPRLAVISVHVDPCDHGGQDAHALTAHHSIATIPTRSPSPQA